MSSANNKGRMSRRKKMEPWYYVGPIFLLLVIMFGYPLIKSAVSYTHLTLPTTPYV